MAHALPLGAHPRKYVDYTSVHPCRNVSRITSVIISEVAARPILQRAMSQVPAVLFSSEEERSVVLLHEALVTAGEQ